MEETESNLAAALDIATWIGSAAGAGVIGNIAYDAVKSLFRRRISGASAGNRSGSPDDVMMAKLAVQLRCEQLGRKAPELDDLTLEGTATEGPEHSVHLRASGLEAIVKIVRQASNDPSLAVTLLMAEPD
jgi:hypothetical protein